MMTTPYLKLERQIAAGDRGSIVARWRYGRELLAAKAGRERLPKGMIGELIKAAERAGLKLSEREIQYRIQCAEAHETEARIRSAAAAMGSWRALCDAGFPSFEPDGSDPEDLEAEGLSAAPDSWEQLQLDIPGLKPEIAVRGRRIRLIRGKDGATATDITAYRSHCEQTHESYGKTVERIRESERIVLLGAAGDPDANAVEAYERGLALEACSADASHADRAGNATTT